MGINRIVLFIIIFTVCLTCGIFIPIYSNTTFDSPKLAVMFIGTSIGCICWAIKGFGNGIYRKTKGINFAILIYLLSCIAAMCLSRNWVISFFGGYKQNGGVLSLLIYLAFFYLCANFINSKNIRTVFKYLIFTSFILSGYGMCQKFDIGTFDTLLMFNGRMYSTFGQPVFFGYFIAMMIPVILYEINKTNKLYLYLVLSILIFAVFISQSRSAFVAIILCSMPLLFIYKNNKWFRKLLLLTMFVIIALIGIYLKRDYTHGGETLYERFLFLGRIGMYCTELKMVTVFPYFGFGQDLLRPHNIILDNLLMLGIVGLISFCYLGFCIIKSISITDYKKDYNLFYTVLASCLSYLVCRQFNPAYIPITLLFVMFAGAIYGIKNSCN